MYAKMEATLANIELGRYRRLLQTFWDPEPSNDTNLDQTVWCLGRQYTLRAEANGVDLNSEEPHQTNSDCSGPAKLTGNDDVKDTAGEDKNYSTWPRKFTLDFESRFWMTYRKDFMPIDRRSSPEVSHQATASLARALLGGDTPLLTSDSGWGCMIRSGQSLLANALSSVKLGRDWHRGEQAAEERNIIAMFADDPVAPYSIHKFVQHGAAACGKEPGEWFGPSATARCIEALVNSHSSDLRVYTTDDGPDVYEDAFLRVAMQNEQFHPTLLLVGTRLGIDKITSVYWEAVISALQMPQSIGIAGGRPSSSHYFVGVQGQFLFYLDPHHTRPALRRYADAQPYSQEEVDSCHTSRLRRLHIREVDPSMLVGFLIRNREDWLDWRRAIKHVQGKSIIHVSDQQPNAHGGFDGDESLLGEVEIISEDETQW